MANKNDKNVFSHRFFESNKPLRRIQPPIQDLSKVNLVGLDEAVKPLIDIVPSITDIAFNMKHESREIKGNLTIDEAAAIRLYTFEASVRNASPYFILNRSLRSAHQEKIKPWLLYLKLILNGLQKLAVKQYRVYRVIEGDFSKQYHVDTSFMYSSFTSCSRSSAIVHSDSFCLTDQQKTVMIINCLKGISIEGFSCATDEQEILLVPNSKFIVKRIEKKSETVWEMELDELENSPSGGEEKISCSKHSTKLLEHWCYDEKQVLCDRCVIESHEGHRHTPIENAEKQKSEQLEKLFRKIESSFKTSYEYKKPSGSKRDETKATIKQTFDELRRLLDNCEKSLCVKVDSIEDMNENESKMFTKEINSLKQCFDQETQNRKKLDSELHVTSKVKGYQSIEDSLGKIEKKLGELKYPKFSEYSLHGFDQLNRKLHESLQMASIESSSTSSLPSGNQILDSCLLSGKGQLFLDSTATSMLRKDKSAKSFLLTIPSNVKWQSKGTRIINNLKAPLDISADSDSGRIYICDCLNARVISIKPDGTDLRVLVKDLNQPTNIVVNPKSNSIFISEKKTQRVLRCSLDNDSTSIETYIENINCNGLAIDEEGSLYAIDVGCYAIIRYSSNNRKGTIVAGNNGRGSKLNQLNWPTSIAINKEGTVYICDNWSHRVVQWKKGAKEGTIVAGFDGKGSKNTQLSSPSGILVDTNDNIYVTDTENNRIIRYRRDRKVGDILIDSSEVQQPRSLCFDQQHNLCVAVKDAVYCFSAVS